MTSFSFQLRMIALMRDALLDFINALASRIGFFATNPEIVPRANNISFDCYCRDGRFYILKSVFCCFYIFKCSPNCCVRQDKKRY